MTELPSAAVPGGAMKPGNAATFSSLHRGRRGRLTRGSYGALRYVPSLRNYVRSLEEQYDSNDVRGQPGDVAAVSLVGGTRPRGRMRHGLAGQTG